MLELDYEGTRPAEAWDHDLIAHIRHCGAVMRTSGLGYKIRTLTSDPDRRDKRCLVLRVVIIESTPDDDDRIRERDDLLMIQARTGYLTESSSFKSRSILRSIPKIPRVS